MDLLKRMEWRCMEVDRGRYRGIPYAPYEMTYGTLRVSRETCVRQISRAEQGLHRNGAEY